MSGYWSAAYVPDGFDWDSHIGFSSVHLSRKTVF